MCKKTVRVVLHVQSNNFLQLYLKLQKVQQLVENTFSTSWGARMAGTSAVYGLILR